MFIESLTGRDGGQHHAERVEGLGGRGARSRPLEQSREIRGLVPQDEDDPGRSRNSRSAHHHPRHCRRTGSIRLGVMR